MSAGFFNASTGLRDRQVAQRLALVRLPLAWLAESVVGVTLWPEGEPEGRMLAVFGPLAAQLLNLGLVRLWEGKRDVARQCARSLAWAAIYAAGPAKILLALIARAGSGLASVPIFLALCGLAWAIDSALAARRQAPGSPWAQAWAGGDALAGEIGALAFAAWMVGTRVDGDPMARGALIMGAVFGGAVWWLRSLRRSAVRVVRVSGQLRQAPKGERR